MYLINKDETEHTGQVWLLSLLCFIAQSNQSKNEVSTFKAL